MGRRRHWIAFSLVVVAVAFVNQQLHAELLYGVKHDTSSPYTSTLVTFDSSSPGTIVSSTLISGSQLGNPDQFTITGIDFRPSTGQLYGVADRSGFVQRAYTINPLTGAATLFSSAPFTSAASWGFDAD